MGVSEINKLAHMFLKNKGVNSIGDKIVAYNVQKMLVEFYQEIQGKSPVNNIIKK